MTREWGWTGGSYEQPTERWLSEQADTMLCYSIPRLCSFLPVSRSAAELVGSLGEDCVLQQGVMDTHCMQGKDALEQRCKNLTVCNVPVVLDVWRDLTLSIFASLENLGGTKMKKCRHFDSCHLKLADSEIRFSSWHLRSYNSYLHPSGSVSTWEIIVRVTALVLPVMWALWGHEGTWAGFRARTSDDVLPIANEFGMVRKSKGHGSPLNFLPFLLGHKKECFLKPFSFVQWALVLHLGRRSCCRVGYPWGRGYSVWLPSAFEFRDSL